MGTSLAYFFWYCCENCSRIVEFLLHIKNGDLGTHCTGDWVSFVAHLYGSGKIFLKPGLEPQAVHPVASRYADYTITHRSNIITECWVLRLSTPHELKLCSWSLGNGSIETLESMMQHSLSDELCFTLPADPYLSPYWASDEVLRQLPPTKIMVSTIRYEKQMQK